MLDEEPEVGEWEDETYDADELQAIVEEFPDTASLDACIHDQEALAATGSRTWVEARDLINKLKTARRYFPVVGWAGIPETQGDSGKKGKGKKGKPT